MTAPTPPPRQRARTWRGRKRPLALLLLIACSKETRSLVPIDITGPADVDLATVSASVSQSGSELSRRMLPWSAGRGGTLKIGIYLPSTVAGTVEVAVSATDLAGAAYDSGPAARVEVASGKAAPVVAMSLQRRGGVASPVDGGADAAPGGGPPADAAVAPTPPSDGSAVDAPPADGAAPAGRRWEPLTNLENDLLNPSYEPSVAIHPTRDHVLVAWWETAAIKVRRYDASTRTWGNVQTLEDRGKPEGVQVAISASGGALAVWRQTDEARLGIWASHSGDSGATWSPPARVHDKRVDFELQLAMADSGDARAVWEEAEFLNSEHVVWSAAFSGTTGAWLPATAVAPSGPVICLTYGHQPRIAMDGAGVGMIAWKDEAAPAQGQDNDEVIYGVPFKGAEPLPRAQLVATDPISKTYPVPAVAPGGGRSFVLWVRYSEGLWQNEYDGVAWKGPTRIATGDPRSPAIVIDRAGVATVAWSQPLAGGPKLNVVVTRSLAGQGWSAPTPLETTNLETDPNVGHPPSPSLGVDAEGNVQVAWRRQTTAAGGYSAIVRSYRAGQWQPEVELAPRKDLSLSHPQIAVARSGAAALATDLLDPTRVDQEGFNVFVSLFR